MRLGIWELLLILAIVLLLFGTRKLKSLGTDLGSAIKGFRSAMQDSKQEASEEAHTAGSDGKDRDKSSG